jgi:hypothetical protein
VAPKPELTDPVPLDLSLTSTDLDKGHVVDTARRQDVVMGTFTDEELILCGDDADSTAPA